MPDLRIQTAIDNGDLSKDHGHKKEWKDTVSADSDEFQLQLEKMFEKEFGRPSIFASPTKTPRSES
jgi:hypothetical protein|tara:strand:- start:418 stop:615 length:198 start_codon:yes stop_codon:yes gene_type:complete